MHLASDEEIAAFVAAAQRFDEVAFDQLYTLYAEALLQFFRSRVSDYQTAEDLTSTVFVRVVEVLPRFRMPDTGQGLAFTAWLFRIAHNKLADHYRRAKYQIVPLDEHWASSYLLADEVERRVETQELRDALTQLTTEQQRIVRLRFMEELSLEEVATRTQQTIGGVKAMQHRALRSLARVLERINPHSAELASEQ